MSSKTKALVNLIIVWGCILVGLLLVEENSPFVLAFFMMALFSVPFCAGRYLRERMRKHFGYFAVADLITLGLIAIKQVEFQPLVVAFVIILFFQLAILADYKEYWGDTYPG